MIQCDWCGKRLAEARANETGYKFCSQECKEKGLYKEKQEIYKAKAVLASKISHLNNELSALVQQDRKHSQRLTQISWTERDHTKKSLIREANTN